MFWKTSPKTRGAEHAAAVSRSSDAWAAELRRLRGELDALAVERSAIEAAAGRALLDGDEARSTDLAAQLARLDSRQRVVGAAVAAAELRRADAERDEQRRRLTLQVREHHALLAAWLAHTASIAEAERALSAAVVARRQAVDSERLAGLYAALVEAGLTPVALEDVVSAGHTPDALRRLAEEHRQLAATATLDAAGGVAATAEPVDAAALPPTAKARAVAAIQASEPEQARRRTLAALDHQLRDARNLEQRLRDDRAAPPADRARARARIVALEAARSSLVAEEAPA